MIAQRNKYFIVNYLFACCLIILILNDHILKFSYHNWLTGKLSDAAGIILLPLLLVYLFPRLANISILVSAALFIFWKSAISEPFIALYNAHAFIQTSRVVDYSDLIVLLLLPVPAFFIHNVHLLKSMKIERVNPIIILLPTIVGLMATSPPPWAFYTDTQGNLKCYKCNVTVSYTQDDIIEKLKSVNITFSRISPIDSRALMRFPSLAAENAHFYHINELIIEEDTLRSIDFTMRTIDNDKTIIYFNGMQVLDDISTEKLEKKVRRHYKRMLFRLLKSNLKHHNK